MVHEGKDISNTEEGWEYLPEWFRKLRELLEEKSK